MKTAVVLPFALLLLGIVVCAQPPDMDSDEPLWSSSLTEWSVGLTLSSLVNGVTGRVWICDQFGVEASLAAVVVPLQVGIRALYRPLRSESASLFIGPGVGWREGDFSPHVAVGTEWLIREQIAVSLFGGIGYIGSGTWLPPGPIPTLSSHLYGFFGISLSYQLRFGERISEPEVPLPNL